MTNINISFNDFEESIFSDKINNLNTLRSYLSANEYKFALASIVAQTYISLMFLKGNKETRQMILLKVNNLLVKQGCNPVSYQFIRKFY